MLNKLVRRFKDVGLWNKCNANRPATTSVALKDFFAIKLVAGNCMASLEMRIVTAKNW